MANTHSLDLERGSSQSAYCADNADVSVTGDITLEAWIKLESLPSSVSGYYTIVSKNDASGGYSYIWYVTTDDKLRFQFTDNGVWEPGHRTYFTCNTALASAGTWYHVAVVVDVSVPSATFYIDGVYKADTEDFTEASGSIHDGTSKFAVGVWAIDDLSVNFFDGKIDEVRLWSDIRTEAEIQDNDEIELVGNETNLVGYWKFNNNYTDSAKSSDLTAVGNPVFSTDVPFAGATTTTSTTSTTTSSTTSSTSSSTSSTTTSQTSTTSSTTSTSTSSTTSSSSSSTTSTTTTGPPVFDYSKGDYASLPTNDSDLENSYTWEEYQNVKTDNGVYTDQSATEEYAIHFFKDQHINNTDPITLEWNGQSTLAPSQRTTYLQIYDRVAEEWSTLDSDSTTGADTDFTLTGSRSTNLSNYYDANYWVKCRVYQYIT